MKRFVVMLLAAALLCSSLVGCDAGGGMLVKLLELLKQMSDGYELVDPPVEFPDYETGFETNIEYSEVYPVDPIPPVSTDVKLIRAHIDVLSEQYSDSRQQIREYGEDQSIQNTRIEVGEDIISLAVAGHIGLGAVDWVDFGYSVNNENRTFDQSFQRDPDPDIKEELYSMGASYVNAYVIQIPMQYWPQGHYMIDLWYHTDDGFENIFCTFEVYISPDEQPSEDVSVDIGVPDDVYPGDVLVMDGDLSDWQEHSHLWAPYDFGESNLDPWVGEVGDKGFTMYIAADTEYVYFAFEVNDQTVVFSEDGQYNGDAFQIAIDFNGWIKDAQQYDRAIFYSFGFQQDGTMDVTVQCIYGDATATVDYKMASDDQEELREGEIKGATRAWEDGVWVAEYAISWETLYRDVSEKLMNNGNSIPNIMFGKDAVDLNMLICYLDHNADQYGNDAGITGAWGTSIGQGALSGSHPTVDGWTPYGMGVIAHLDPGQCSGYIESLFEQTN